MLIDDIRELLKGAAADLTTIQHFWRTSPFDERIALLTAQSEQPDFWQDPNQGEVLKELQGLKEKRSEYDRIMAQHSDLDETATLFADDEASLQQLLSEVKRHTREMSRYKITLLLSQPDDTKNCYLTINSGAGGTESQDWSEILLRMYVRFCERERLTAEVLDMQTGEGAGIKSATLFIKGKYAQGLLKSEEGIHRLVRISPFDANKRRHTSFCGVTLTPEAPDIAIVIKPDDLRIDTYRAGGAGGQHVNKTDSAVRITHLPTNIVVQCQNERSQLQNKETAMKMLKARLYQREKEERERKSAAIERKQIEWGSQIRSYVLHPYKMVKDHRTDYESMQPEDVLDGDLMGFIEAYLLWYPTHQG